jgi:hypothetical protein
MKKAMASMPDMAPMSLVIMVGAFDVARFGC